MTRVDFYLVGGNGKRELFTCRLVQKIYQQGHRAYVLVESDTQAQALDNALWTFNESSFVPHALHREDRHADADSPVLLGTGEPPADIHDVLILLSAETPAWFSRFERVAEVVGNSDNERASARERFRFYRDRGYPLDTHEV